MRLAITCHASFGGSGVIASELALALAQRGHEVHVVAAARPPRLPSSPVSRLTFHEVRTPEHPLLPQGEYTLALASKLAEVGRHVDLLHVHYAIPLATSALLARQLLGEAAPKLVTTVHGTDALTLGLEDAFRPLVRQALEASDVVTAPSAWLAGEARRGLGLSREVVAVPNFVDTARFSPAPGPRSGPRRLTHTSNFRSLKRVQDVVRIYERVRRTVDCELELIGDGPERPAVEALVRELGLQGVRFVGELLDVVPRLRASDVFLMPSELESFGLAALEAMSCGVPVVASDVGGLPEVVRSGATGFLHAPHDVAAMAASTLDLLREPKLHASMAKAARESALARFQLAPIVFRWEALYGALLENA